MNEVFSESIISPMRISHNVTCNQAKKLLHVHDNGFELLLFIRGNVNYFLETSIYHLEPGDILLVPPNTIHGYLMDDSDYERIPLHIQRNLLVSLSTKDTSLSEAFGDSKHRVVHLNPAEMKEYITHADAIIQSGLAMPYGHDVFARAHLMFLLLIVNKAYRNSYYSAKDVDVSPKVIRNAIDYINSHLTDNLTVQSISDDLSISNSRLSHLFKEHTGSSVWNYVMAKRLMLARNLLLEGKSVMDACYESGFRDYSHFNKSFSKAFDIAPGKFLKDKKKGNANETK